MSAPAATAQETQASGSSFYAGMRVLPKAEREAMFAVYGFCRQVDDIADDLQGERTQRRAQLDAWRADIEALYAGKDPGRAALVAEAVRRFGLHKADFLAVIDGMQMDADEDIRAPAMAKLDLYCDRVASAVGRLSVRIFGMDEGPGEALAFHLGQISMHRAVARQHQVVAVVDHRVQLGVVIGPAAAAGLGGAFEQLHPLATPGQGHGGGEAREPRADHVDGAAQASSPWRTSSQSSSALGSTRMPA